MWHIRRLIMRYIIDKKGVELLKLSTLPALETLTTDITITNEELRWIDKHEPSP